MKRILGLSLFVGLLLCQLMSVADAQEKMRIVNDLYLPKDAPIQIVGRELEGRKFDERRIDNRSGSLANSDWIKHLTFVVKNVSKKNVSYVRITLMVPQQKQMPGPMVYEISFGSRNGTDELISPGEAAKVKIRESEYLSWEKRLKDWGVNDLDHVLLELRTIYFDDGTGWSLGRDIMQDPLTKKWIYSNQPKPKISSRISFFGLDLFEPIRLMPDFLHPASPEAVICGWGEEESNPRECQGCTNPVDTAACDQFINDTFHLQPTGDADAGYLTQNVQQFCRSTSPGTSNCGSCPAGGYASYRFTRFTNCGQPQPCGNISIWGCVSPLVDDGNGFCQMSPANQSQCAHGFDPATCSCLPPPPTPTPTPTPPPCLTDGNWCWTNGECCSGWCNGNLNQCWTSGITDCVRRRR